MSFRAALARNLNSRNLRVVSYGTLCVSVLLFFSACAAPPPPANGWAIVVADPATGDVGVAAASCSAYPIDYRAVLVPDKGAGVLLGVNSPLLRDRMGEWIEQPLTAEQIVPALVSPTNDPNPEQRNYAVVTFNDNRYYTAESQGAGWGSTMGHVPRFATDYVGRNMAAKIWDENISHTLGYSPYISLPLPDRLLLALEAGSADGGVALCNQNNITQTASTAFIMLARHGAPTFKVQTLGNTAAQEPNPPYLALSVTEPIGGKNAVLTLREQYDLWRAQNLPPCAECDQARITVPQGGTNPATETFFNLYALQLLAAFVLLTMLLTILYFTLRHHLPHSNETSPFP